MELKNRCSEVLELVALFLLKREGFSQLLYLLCQLRFGLKKEGQIQSISLLAPHLVVLQFSFSSSFKLFFLYCGLYSPQVSDYSVSCNKALGKNTLADRRQSVGNLPLFVRQLSEMCQPCILRSNLTSMCSEFYVHDIEFKLAVMKLESSEACLLKLENNSVVSFQVIDIFCKHSLFKKCLNLKRFYTFQNISKSSLKLHYSLLSMPKIIQIG